MKSKKTNQLVNWDRFLEEENQNINILLEFDIEAGFSITTAMAIKDINKNKKTFSSVSKLKIPDIKLKIERDYKEEGIRIKKITISTIPNTEHKITEKYLISAYFSPLKIDYEKIKSNILQKKEEISENLQVSLYLNDLFLKKAESVQKKIIDHIQLSGFFAKTAPASFNLYLEKDSKIDLILQKAGGYPEATHSPVRPGEIKIKNILQNEDFFEKIPENIKKHLQKGIQYKFLGFYDESLLSYYKAIESSFRNPKFVEITKKETLSTNNKEVEEIIKNANQKTMMLFIYQTIIKNDKKIKEEEKEEILKKMIELSKVRNEVAHSSDQTKKSEPLNKFIFGLCKIMINKIIQ